MISSTVHVLLVEDDDDHAYLIRAAFEDHAAVWQLKTVRTVAEARRQLRHSDFQIVITDLVLPDGRGTELLSFSTSDEKVPLILMTSHGNEAVAVEAMKAGAMDYVVKSEYSFSEMPRVAERVIREWNLIQEREQAKIRESQLLAQLAHADRRNTMGEMATVLAHEVNQPLAAIANYAGTCVELFTRDRVNLSDLREALVQIDHQARRAGEIVNRLKQFVTKAAPKFTEVDVNHLVREFAGLMRGIASLRQSKVDLDLQEPLPLIQADTVQLQQVLVNLAQNALEAMDQVMPQDRRILLETRMNSNTVSIIVSDRGHGISQDIWPRLFEPYFTTKDYGMGMGLSISHRIIEAHGGQLKVVQSSQAGTTFQITLPVSSDYQSTQQAPNASPIVA